MPPRHDLPNQRSRDRVEHHDALVREDDDREHRLTQAHDGRVAFGAQVLPQGDSRYVAADRARQLNVGGEREHQHPERGPHGGRSGQEGPTGRKQQHEGGRNEASPQVVEDLPARDHRQRVDDLLTAGTGNLPPQPTRDLPVAPHPSVLARRKGEVASWIVVDEVDIGHEPGARVKALEEIVAEQRVLGHAPGERGIERVHVIDAFADVAALVKHVLIEVRHGGRVRIHADVPGEHPREHRPVGAHDADADARLQHAVAFGHALKPGIESGPVQRM